MIFAVILLKKNLSYCIIFYAVWELGTFMHVRIYMIRVGQPST
jgi:hypothetical protein